MPVVSTSWLPWRRRSCWQGSSTGCTGRLGGGGGGSLPDPCPALQEARRLTQVALAAAEGQRIWQDVLRQEDAVTDRLMAVCEQVMRSTACC